MLELDAKSSQDVEGFQRVGTCVAMRSVLRVCLGSPNIWSHQSRLTDNSLELRNRCRNIINLISGEHISQSCQLVVRSVINRAIVVASGAVVITVIHILVDDDVQHLHYVPTLCSNVDHCQVGISG